MKICIILILLINSLSVLQAQDTLKIKPSININGYLKGLESVAFGKINHTSSTNHLLHNRLNLKYKPNKTILLAAEFRNRLFFGEQVKATSQFVEQLTNSTEQFNMQKLWVQSSVVVLHTNIERLYVDLTKQKWNARIGRQRVNWGIASTWNPNDIFNVYNFLDFDYQERPGIDGIKLQYLSSNVSNIELVYSSTNSNKNSVASKFAINLWNYDFQFIAGSFKGNATLGTGWAGNIKDAGFKGELQYYFKDNYSISQLNAAIGLDYMFNKGLYLDLGGLYNSNGLTKSVNNWNEINLNLSAKNLMPAKYSFIVSLRKEISPIASISNNLVYSPGLKLLILMPSFSYNISNSIDTDLMSQLFFMQTPSSFKEVTVIGYFRLRYSF